MNRPDNLPTQPSPGDICVGCIHRPNPDGCHYYYIPEGMKFSPPGEPLDMAKAKSAHWILLCDICEQGVNDGGGITNSIEEGKLLIGCDMEWPENLEVKMSLVQ
jgi:hypothetical protein